MKNSTTEQKQRILPLLIDQKRKGKKSLAILIDPDKAGEKHLAEVVAESQKHSIDYFFVGGSLITSDALEQTISFLKSSSDIPVIIFPGSNIHIHERADAILYLSLISGRNPEYLIGQHVVAASRLKASSLEILSTGYLLIDGGKPSTVTYISNTSPIPQNKPEIAAATALAGELMGMSLIYLDSGSGAMDVVSTEMISTVSGWVTAPLIVGGGIDSVQKASKAWEAGADIVVVGNAFEQSVSLIGEISVIL